MKIIITIFLSLLSACSYRAGGMAKNPDTKPTWIPMWLRSSWVRDWLIPLFSISTLLIWKPSLFSWWIMLAYPLMGASFSTYWDFLFGYDNYYMHGFMIGLSVFPFCFVGLAWWVVLVQAILMAVSMGLWSKVQTNDVKEEMGRGFFSTCFRFIV